MNIFETVLQYIAPSDCLQCGTEGSLLCASCSALLPSIQLPSSTPDMCIYARTSYSGVARELVRKLKFERASAAAADMSRSMAGLLPAGMYDGIAYVPTAPARVRQRGYDQARLLAKGVAEAAHLPFLPLLARTGNQRQVGAQRAQRLVQMQYAFRMSKPYPAQAKRLLLVDDVLTTGSTIRSAAVVLRAAGARRVDALVFAAA